MNNYGQNQEKNLPGRIVRSTPIGSMCNIFSRLHRCNRSKYPDAPQPRQLSTANEKKNEIHIKYFNMNTKICFLFASGTANIIPEKEKTYHSCKVLIFSVAFCDPVSFNYTLCNDYNLSVSLCRRSLSYATEENVDFLSFFFFVIQINSMKSWNNKNSYWNFDEWIYVSTLYQSLYIGRIVCYFFSPFLERINCARCFFALMHSRFLNYALISVAH